MTDFECPECGEPIDDDDCSQEESRSRYEEQTFSCECAECGCVFYASQSITYVFTVDEHGKVYRERQLLAELGQAT